MAVGCVSGEKRGTRKFLFMLACFFYVTIFIYVLFNRHHTDISFLASRLCGGLLVFYYVALSSIFFKFFSSFSCKGNTNVSGWQHHVYLISSAEHALKEGGGLYICICSIKSTPFSIMYKLP